MANVFFFDLRDASTGNFNKLQGDRHLLWDKKTGICVSMIFAWCITTKTIFSLKQEYREIRFFLSGRMGNGL